MHVPYQALLVRGRCVAFRDDDDGDVVSVSDVLQKSDLPAQQHP